MATTNDDTLQVINDVECDELVAHTLREAATSLTELHRQARHGRFESEKLRRCWFVIAGLGRA